MPRTPEPHRHIPEEELHAYLDQALSRSQCVEIEHHLAGCPPCRAERDAIAALRDRTTALLVTAAPRRIRPRPYAELSAAFHHRRTRRSARLRDAAWAAGVFAALGLGWGLNHWSSRRVPADPVAVAPPAAGQIPAVSNAAPIRNPAGAPPAAPATVAAGTPSTPIRTATTRLTPDPRTAARIEPPAVEPVEPPRPAGTSLSSLGGTAATREPVLSGVWRTVTWSESQEESDEWVPRVDGVPVVQVKQRQAPQGGRPITLVTQLLANGEVISTVEGPATEVAELLSAQPGQSASGELHDMEDSSPAASAVGAGPATTNGAPRTLAIFGSAPSDSLRAFMLRVK